MIFCLCKNSWKCPTLLWLASGMSFTFFRGVAVSKKPVVLVSVWSFAPSSLFIAQAGYWFLFWSFAPSSLFTALAGYWFLFWSFAPSSLFTAQAGYWFLNNHYWVFIGIIFFAIVAFKGISRYWFCFNELFKQKLTDIGFRSFKFGYWKTCLVYLDLWIMIDINSYQSTSGTKMQP